MQNNELDVSSDQNSLFSDSWTALSETLEIGRTPLSRKSDTLAESFFAGVSFESGQIIFEAGIPEECKPQRTSLVQALEKRFAKDPDALKELNAKLEQLDKSFTASTDETLRQFPHTLAARYSHVAALLKADCSPKVITKAIEAKLDAKAIALDSSGKYDNKFQLAKFPEEDNWLYKHHWQKESPRQKVEEQRTAEIWQAQSSSDDTTKKSIITVTRNGERIESWVIDRSGDKATFSMQGIEGPDPKEDVPQLQQAREKLFTSILQSGMKPDEQMEMIRDLTQMESRARTGAFEKSNQGELGGTRAELARTYSELNRLFTAPEDKDVPASLKLVVARQLARELGDPGDIDQGQSSDACRIATVQYRLATVRPSVVAKLVVDGLIDGKVRTTETFDFDVRNRKPSSPQSITFPRPENERSFASQIFQLAAMNTLGRDKQLVAEHIAYTNEWRVPEKSVEVPAGYTRLEFVQTDEMHEVWSTDANPVRTAHRKRGPLDERPNLINNGMTVTAVNDRGDRFVITNTALGQERKDGGNHILLQAYASQTLLDKLDPKGKHEKCVLAHSGMTLYTRDNTVVPGIQDKTVSFDDENGLRTLIKQAKDSGNLPIIIASRDYSMGAAYHGLKPKMKEEMETALKSIHNTHIMIIRDYVPADPARGIKEHLVTDDFFGKKYDRRILPTDEWRRYFMNTSDTNPK